MDINEVREDMRVRFTSDNAVPVERAHITREQWDVVCERLDLLDYVESTSLDIS